MHEWLIHTVILPQLKAIAELCEKQGISCVFHIEHNDQICSDWITHSVQGDASQTIKNTFRAAEGRFDEQPAKRAVN